MPLILLALAAVAQADPIPEPTPIAEQEWISADDYPAPALLASQEGRVAYRLDVDAAGNTTRCTVITSSGSPVLDVHTCDLMRMRAHFRPAYDRARKPLASVYSSAVNWRLPDGRPFDVAGLPPVDGYTIDFLVGSDGRVTQCDVIDLTGERRDPHAVNPCADYAVGSRYTDPTTSNGRPVAGRIRRTVSETRSYQTP